MTGYQSKKAAAQDKLAQPEQEALKLALEALKEIARHATTPWEDEWCGELANETLKAINALAQPAQEILLQYPKEAIDREMEQQIKAQSLAQPAQEPWRESASDYERGVIDGRQMQAQSSVDKAVNAMTQRTWVGLTKEDMPAGENPMFDHEYFIKGMVFAATILKEKNT